MSKPMGHTEIRPKMKGYSAKYSHPQIWELLNNNLMMNPKTRVEKGDIMPKKKKQEDIIKFQAENNEIKTNNKKYKESIK